MPAEKEHPTNTTQPSAPFPTHAPSGNHVTEHRYSRNPQTDAQRCRLALFLFNLDQLQSRTFFEAPDAIPNARVLALFLFVLPACSAGF